MRLLGTSGYVLIPVTGGSRDLLGRAQPLDQLCLWARDGSGGALSCFTLAQIRTGRAELGFRGAPRKSNAQIARINAQIDAFAHSHPGGTAKHYRQSIAPARTFGLAPDGVVTVRRGSASGAPAAHVTDNFYEFRGRAALGSATVYFLDANGKVLFTTQRR